MSLSRPSNDVPHHVLDWLNWEKDPMVINQFLSECRKTHYAKNLDLDDPASIICHALTTKNLKKVPLDKLKAVIAKATMMDGKSECSPSDTSQILINPLLLQALELIVKAKDATDLRKKHLERDAARIELTKLLRVQAPFNPFINLPHIEVENADLRGANLQLANFRKAKFTGVKFEDAKLDYANLSGVVAADTNFTGVNLAKANLNWGHFEKSTLPTNSGPFTLKTFLQTYLPSNIRLEDVPSPQLMKDVLHEIKDSLESELHKEYGLVDRTKTKLSHHEHHNMITDNLAKIAKEMTKIPERKGFVENVLAQPFYTDFGSEPVVSKVNEGLINVHNFFSCHKRKTNYFGAPSCNKLVKMLNECNKELNTHPLPEHHHHHQARRH